MYTINPFLGLIARKIQGRRVTAGLGLVGYLLRNMLH